MPASPGLEAARHPVPEPTLQAVLWDMDGTLIDTEPHWLAAEQELCAEHGGTWDEALAHELIGLPLMVS
ncbi:MAG TPA: HAD hydrolase-like protein, partial [Beutenbergiaceae bacterium]|nr:HAD hydrolase-like protein [Beutenbergiaceae bacterium]